MIELHRILVPTDFGDSSTPAVRYAARMAEAFGAELILLNVVPDAALILPDAVMPAPVPTTDISRFMADGNRSIADAAEGCQAMPMPSTNRLPSQKVRPDRKQIFATSIAVRP